MVIPAFDEEDTILRVIERVRELPFSVQIIVVDDCSRDRTAALVQGLEGVEFRRHDRNQGKGAALRTGSRWRAADVVVVQDADLEYDPADIPALIQPILAGPRRRRVRLAPDRRPPAARPPLLAQVGNKALSLVTNVLYNTTLSDMETGYKAFRSRCCARSSRSASRTSGSSPS